MSSDAAIDANSPRQDGGERDASGDADTVRDASEGDAKPPPKKMDAAIDATAMQDADVLDAGADATNPQPDASEDAGVDAADPAPPTCELGLSDVASGAWVPYVAGESIPLTGAGQSALLIEMALRMRGPPIPATVDVVVTAIESGREERTVRPDEDMFDCDAQNVCDFSPMFLRTFNLVDNPFFLDDLVVAIDAEVSTDDGVFCTAHLEGFLLRRF